MEIAHECATTIPDAGPPSTSMARSSARHPRRDAQGSFRACALRLFGLVRIDGRRQIAVTAYFVHTFFDAYLRETASPPHIASPLYPELDVSTGAQPFPR